MHDLPLKCKNIICGIKCKCSSEAEAPASCHKIPLIHLCSIVQYACILYFVYTNSVDHIFHCYIPAAFFCWCGVEITKWAVIISLISFTLNCITTMRSRTWLLHFDRGISSVLVQIPLMRKLTQFSSVSSSEAGSTSHTLIYSQVKTESVKRDRNWRNCWEFTSGVHVWFDYRF